MTTLTLRTQYDALLDIEAFVVRHPQVGEPIRRCLDPSNIVNGFDPRIVVPVTSEPDPRGAATTIVTAAIADGIPVTVDPTGRFLHVRLDFDGMAIVVLDYQATHADDSVLYALAEGRVTS